MKKIPTWLEKASDVYSVNQQLKLLVLVLGIAVWILSAVLFKTINQPPLVINNNQKTFSLHYKNKGQADQKEIKRFLKKIVSKLYSYHSNHNGIKDLAYLFNDKIFPKISSNFNKRLKDHLKKKIKSKCLIDSIEIDPVSGNFKLSFIRKFQLGSHITLIPLVVKGRIKNQFRSKKNLFGLLIHQWTEVAANH